MSQITSSSRNFCIQRAFKYAKVSNSRANKLIKQLNGALSAGHNKMEIICEALDIYNNIDEPKNQYAMTSYLKLCLRLKSESKGLLIWNDVLKLNQYENSMVTLILLFKCCIQSNKVDIEKCIQLLTHFVDSKHQSILLHGSFITKLISKCGTNIDALRYIHTLIDRDFFVGNAQNIIIKNALINGYSLGSHLSEAMDVFKSVPNDTKDVITYCSMMKDIEGIH